MNSSFIDLKEAFIDLKKAFFEMKRAFIDLKKTFFEVEEAFIEVEKRFFTRNFFPIMHTDSVLRQVVLFEIHDKPRPSAKPQNFDKVFVDLRGKWSCYQSNLTKFFERKLFESTHRESSEMGCPSFGLGAPTIDERVGNTTTFCLSIKNAASPCW